MLGPTKDVTMRRLLLLVIAASLSMAAPARAEKVDLSTITCKRFFEYSKENVSLMLMWLDGYYTEDDDDPIKTYYCSKCIAIDRKRTKRPPRA